MNLSVPPPTPQRQYTTVQPTAPYSTNPNSPVVELMSIASLDQQHAYPSTLHTPQPFYTMHHDTTKGRLQQKWKAKPLKLFYKYFKDFMLIVLAIFL